MYFIQNAPVKAPVVPLSPGDVQVRVILLVYKPNCVIVNEDGAITSVMAQLVAPLDSVDGFPTSSYNFIAK